MEDKQQIIRTDIAAIGKEDTVALFNAVGVTTYYTDNPDEIDQIIFKLSKANCKIIFVSEKVYSIIPETLEKYATSAYPIILPIPLDETSDGLGLKRIRQNVEKAIGINIF